MMKARINLTNEQLRALQMAEFELLCEFRRVCEKAGIRYSIIAGTLLGAVRHKGFIPWDDDADVALLRTDYMKFRKACAAELNHDKYYFQDQTVTEGYRWGYGKLRMKNSKFVRLGQEHVPYEQGIFIDVFPLDHVPDAYWGRCVMNFFGFAIRKALWSAVGQKTAERKFERVIFSLLARIPLAFVKKYYDRLVDHASRINSDWVRILTFPTPDKNWGYPAKYYENLGEHVFEGQTFAGPKDFNGYLTFKYGDWMSIPPEGQRKTHPVSEFETPENFHETNQAATNE